MAYQHFEEIPLPNVPSDQRERPTTPERQLQIKNLRIENDATLD